jgi:DNA recombination protein RmuC
MAVLNTARAVLKDVETRKQIHVIKEALGRLGQDFRRFDDRMKKLADHIRLAHQDAEDVQTSSRKISQQFQRIESAELESPPDSQTHSQNEAAQLRVVERRDDGKGK